jgi:EF-P beta-lysylation protein EpmB
MGILASAGHSVRATPSAQPTSTASEANAWRTALRTAVRDAAQLIRAVGLPDSLLAEAQAAERSFPVFAPLGYIARMRSGDPFDPLLRQVLPLGDELRPVAGFSRDPVGDQAATLSPGLLQKYHSRALIVSTSACAVHCRYCFRREFPYEEAPRSPAAWQPALDRVAADPTIDEVILSGGDPLTLVDSQLADLVARIAAIPHIRRLRVHTRLPVIIPERVTGEMLAWLAGTRLTPIVVLHANHANEIDASVEAALARLTDVGVPLLNQAVLLRGVNDSVEALENLCRKLVDLRVMPYYLHQLDRVVGAAHFEVPVEQGMVLVDKLRARLPGYAVPRYVQEVPGETGKRVLL